MTTFDAAIAFNAPVGFNGGTMVDDAYAPPTAALFGDVEDAVIIWLQSQLAESVYDRVPKVTGALLPLVIVERLGGPATSVVTEEATVTVEAWAKSWRTAQNLVQRARQAVHSLPGNVVAGLTFYRVREYAGPGRLPDPISGFPRFVFTVSLTVRATQ